MSPNEKPTLLYYYYTTTTAAADTTTILAFVMPRPPLIGGGIKRCFCLTSAYRIHRAEVEK